MKDSYWQLILQAIKDNTLPTSIKILFIIAGIYFICPVDLLSGSPIDDQNLVGCRQSIIFDCLQDELPIAVFYNSSIILCCSISSARLSPASQ